jgi:polysaccharide transporter, PST family
MILLQLVSTAILARLLMPADYGVIAMAGTAVALMGVLTNLGLTTPTVQRVCITHEQVSTLFFINAAGGLILFLLTCLIAPLFGAIFHNDQVPILAVLLALSIPIAAITGQFNAVLARNMRWLTIQLINLAGQVTGAAVAILLAWKVGWGAYALVAQTVISAFLVLVLTWAVCPWGPSLHFDLRSVRSELAMGFDLLIFNIVNYAHRQADNIILGNRWGAVELGYYSRAYNLMVQANLVASGPITNALIPALSRAGDNSARWRNIFLESASVTAAGCGGLFTILWAVRDPLVAILFGPRWHDVTPIFGYLAIAGLSTSVCSPFSWAFITLGRTRQQLFWILSASPVLVLAFWVGASFGGLGVAMSYALTVSLLNFFYVAIALKGTPVSYIDGLSVKSIPYAGFVFAVAGNSVLDAYFTSPNAIVDFVMRGTLAGTLYALILVFAVFVVPAYDGVRSLLSAAWELMRTSHGNS